MGPLTWVLDVGQRAACGSSDVPTVHKSNPPIKMDRSKSKDAGGALLVLPHSSLAAGQVLTRLGVGTRGVNGLFVGT